MLVAIQDVRLVTASQQRIGWSVCDSRALSSGTGTSANVRYDRLISRAFKISPERQFVTMGASAVAAITS